VGRQTDTWIEQKHQSADATAVRVRVRADRQTVTQTKETNGTEERRHPSIDVSISIHMIDLIHMLDSWPGRLFLPTDRPDRVHVSLTARLAGWLYALTVCLSDRCMVDG